MATADQQFDKLMPSELRHLSRTHWTPVEVAIRAATLLCPAPGMRILDVGAGVGKLCMVGALSSASSWCGVERHEMLVTAARKLSRSLGLGDRTMFVHGDAFSIGWEDFDALYFYNPFELEVANESPEHEDDYRGQIERTEDRLAGLLEGVRVVTLNGFGGIMPPTYRLVYQEKIPNVGLDLVLWIKGAAIRRTVSVS